MTGMTLRRILHVDMDAFYASVEQRDDPALRGRPVAVGGSPNSRGVVCAASYEARKFGVRSAIPMSRAVRLCPELVVVPPNFRKYGEVSGAVFSIFRSVTPLVEPLSLDEAYLDVTENVWDLPLGVDVARRIKERIREDVHLTASAGVAPNKFLAKIASGWKKPDGLTVIAPERVESFLQRLPVDALWGVGPVTARKLREAGIERLVDVRTADGEVLRHAVGSWAEGLRRLAFGEDDRRVEPNRERKSVGCEETYAKDLVDPARIHAEVEALARRAADFLARKELFARTVTLKLRYATFETITRSATRSPATRSPEEIAGRAVALLEKTDAGRRPVRLLGVSLHGLGPAAAEASVPDQDAPQLGLPVDSAIS
ncbi:MAG TPA: DNA polymerase IV [Thermoanaerobaculia bacterium]